MQTARASCAAAASERTERDHSHGSHAFMLSHFSTGRDRRRPARCIDSARAAAGRAAAGRLHGANERADELAFDLRPARRRRALAVEKRARVLDVVDPRWSRCRCRRSPRPRVWRGSPILERAGDAADPQLHVLRIAAGTSPRTTTSETAKRPPGFSTRNASLQHPVLVARQVDHAVGDDDVDRIVGQRNVLDLAFEELDVFDPALRWFSRASASISSVMSRP